MGRRLPVFRVWIGERSGLVSRCHVGVRLFGGLLVTLASALEMLGERDDRLIGRGVVAGDHADSPFSTSVSCFSVSTPTFSKTNFIAGAPILAAPWSSISLV